MRRIFIVFIFIGFLSINRNVSAQDATYLFITPSSNPAATLSFRINSSVQQYVKYYQGRGRLMMETGLARSGKFSKLTKRIFREEGIPENLIWIAQTSSNWKSPNGWWVFNIITAKKYGLKKNKYLDEGKSFESATRAVARYLKFLSEKYEGNWELAIAAYSTGELNVDSAIKRSKTKDFWAISPYLPNESRGFVPNVLATILIAANPALYGFENVQFDAPISYDRIRIPPLMSLETIAKFADSNLETIKSLNPELISIASPPYPYIILIPEGKGKIFVERTKNYLQKNTSEKK